MSSLSRKLEEADLPQERDGAECADQSPNEVIEGEEAVQIYATEISRNLARLNGEIKLLREECDRAQRLLQEIE